MTSQAERTADDQWLVKMAASGAGRWKLALGITLAPADTVNIEAPILHLLTRHFGSIAETPVRPDGVRCVLVYHAGPFARSPARRESENDDPKLFQHNYRGALSRDDAPSKHAMG